VLILSSITGGNRKVEVPADRINLDFVLANKVMVGTVNAARENFEEGVRDMAMAEAQFAGWLSRLLTHPVKGLENYEMLFQALLNGNGAIKVFCARSIWRASRSSMRPELSVAGLNPAELTPPKPQQRRTKTIYRPAQPPATVRTKKKAAHEDGTGCRPI
jgi:hypothetical protein